MAKKSTVRTLTKKWEILQEAKKYLAWSAKEKNKQMGICFALDTTCCQRVPVDGFVVDEIKQIISSRLGGYLTLRGWLGEFGNISFETLDKDFRKNSYRKLQATRHAWVDSMIAEFKAKDE